MASRPITLTREGEVFRLAFRYHPDLVAEVSRLPFANFDRRTSSWTTRACAQTLHGLRSAYHRGLLDVSPDDLMVTGETFAPAAEAVLRAGTSKRPYYVHLATRDSDCFPAFRAIVGSQWDKGARALTFPPSAAVPLADMVDRGTLADPDQLLSASGVQVGFDTRVGRFVVRGDARAAAAFHDAFPHTDVMDLWKSRGLDANFFDPFSASMYAGELARVGEGLQPAGMKLPLKPYQQQAVAMLVARRGLAIFDEPGLGKTVQAIGGALALLERDAITRAVFVVPASVRTQWESEILRFVDVAPEDVVVVRSTDGRPGRLAAYEAAANARWLVVHYDVLSTDLEALRPLFTGALVVSDETHRIKNFRAGRTKAMRELALGAAARLALTGTPVETNPAEWFAVLDFSLPGCLGGDFDFNERYRYKTNFGFEGAKNTGELRERSRPFYVRRTKAMVAQHLPPLQVSTVVLDPSPAYAGALRIAHSKARDEIAAAAGENYGARNTTPAPGTDGTTQPDLAGRDVPDKDARSNAADMSAVGQLRLLCSSPRLIVEDSLAGQALIDAGLVLDEDGPKVEEIRSQMQQLKAMQERRKEQLALEGRDEATAAEVTPERVVIFSFSERMVRLLSDRLGEDGVPHVTYTGKMKGADRDEAVARFKDPTSDVIAFISTDAGAEGLNLGACCANLINVDLPWTASKLTQRAQRIHRMDSTAPHYQVTNLVVAGTLEGGVLRMLEGLAELSDALLGEGDGRRVATGSRSRRNRGGLDIEGAIRDVAAAQPLKVRKSRRQKSAASSPLLAATTERPEPALKAAKATVREPESQLGPDMSEQLSLL